MRAPNGRGNTRRESQGLATVPLAAIGKAKSPVTDTTYSVAKSKRQKGSLFRGNTSVDRHNIGSRGSHTSTSPKSENLPTSSPLHHTTCFGTSLPQHRLSNIIKSSQGRRRNNNEKERRYQPFTKMEKREHDELSKPHLTEQQQQALEDVSIDVITL